MILFIDQSGQIGGAELCLADLAEHRKDGRVVLFADGPFAQVLRRRNVGVEILALPGGASRITKQASPAALAATIPGLCAHVLALRRRCREADLLFFNTAKALIHGTAANVLPRRPCIHHLHDLWDRRHFSGVNIRLLTAAANRADTVIANSRATADQFLRAGGRSRVEVIPNGFDPRPFDRAPAGAIRELRHSLSPSGRPVAAIFGRLSRWKGQDILLRAAWDLPDLEVWIVGEAMFTGDDHAYAGELRSLAADPALRDRVRFLGFRDDIPELMRAADIVVHGSVSPEPFGRVIAEAMLARKPVVASAAGGPLEIVEDAVTGLLVPPGDPAACRAAIAQLTADPAAASAMGERGRVRAETHFALPVVLAQTDAVINALLRDS
ncbi:MAG TPA: glycosyltransferase family 4 protein [Terrimicrobiaceae bacterium]|nr:glycosyltransferase family 4 protein [Terrimicrobiaceae bacterium]